MRKVILNMKEQKKYEVIKKLCDSGGNKQRAAVLFGVSNKIIALYRVDG